MSEAPSWHPSFLAEHEATHVVVALVTMGNRPESVTIEPGEGYGGRRVGRASVASSVAENLKKRRVRRAMTLLAPAVLAAPYDLFARSDAEFLHYFFAPGVPHEQDARDVRRIFLVWWDTPNDMLSTIRAVASRTKVLLRHPIVKSSIQEIKERLVRQPTLRTEDLEDVTRMLLARRQEIMTWLRFRMRAGRGHERSSGSDSASGSRPG